MVFLDKYGWPIEIERRELLRSLLRVATKTRGVVSSSVWQNIERDRRPGPTAALRRAHRLYKETFGDDPL